MTREEAIQWLTVINTKEFGWDEFALQESQREIRERCEQGVREAIDMAIEALKAPQTDYISRADAIEAVAQQWLFEASVGNPYVNDDDIGEYRKLAEELFEDVPSADAVQGEWIEKYNGNGWNDFWDYTCSNCGKKYERADAVLYHANYCPNCGARMYKGGDDE